MEWVLMEAISRHEGEGSNWEKPTHTSANLTVSHCQQFIVCFILLLQALRRLTLLMKIEAKAA